MKPFVPAMFAASVALLGCGLESSRHSPPQDHAAVSSYGVHGPSLDLVSEATSHIAAREYWASETERGLQAPNRANDFRTHFDGRGVSVEDRDAAVRTPLVELSLTRMGRGDGLSPIDAGEVFDRGEGRVEIVRPELGLTEWFENTHAGLEQGFTLARPPSERTSVLHGDRESDDALVLELSVTGAEATPFGESIRLATRAGRGLEYGKLAVVDAKGRALAARFEAPRGDHIQIVVDDREAEYPIVIDPLLTGAFDAAVESNQAFSEFGVSVASAGDVNGDGFDDVIVGATLYDLGQTDEGAAFIFLGSPTGIGNGNPATAHAVLQSDQATSGFGRHVASAGDVNGDGYADVIVGAYIFDSGQVDEGVAFVFHGHAGGITSGGPGVSSGSIQSDQANAWMGFSVASAGDVDADGYGDVIVGAATYDAGEIDEGAAFIVLGSPTGIGNRTPATAETRLEGEQAGAWFGHSVAGAGDVDADGDSDVIVGAPYYNFLLSDSGSAYLFHGSPSGIADGDINTAPGAFVGDQAFSRFAETVASAGDVNGDGYADVIIGAAFQDNGQSDEGNAFIFHGGPTGLSGLYNPASANRRLESNQADARYGTSVASAGDVNGDGYADVIVGSHGYDAGEAEEGVAFIYPGGASGVGALLTSVQFNQANAVLGYSVASAGDVNGDGFDDVIAGAFLANGGQADEGVAFVYHGGAGTQALQTPATASAQISTPQTGTNLGWSVASAGDVNGDGYSDVIVGALTFDDGELDEGAAFIYHGSASGTVSGGVAAIPDTILTSDQADAFLGVKVNSAGDVNGDGYGDVIVGANSYDSPESDEGAAFVFLGSPSGVASGGVASAHARFESNQAAARMGVDAASAGDVNGDGYGDVIVGAEAYDNGQVDEGAAFLFLGSSSGIANGNPANAAAILESNQPEDDVIGLLVGSFFGSSVASAGDVNADGYGDVIVGAAGYVNGQEDEGSAFVFLGSASGIASGNPATAHASIESNQVGAWLGLSVASAGDVNGDGYADVIVGANGFSTLNSDGPVAYVFLGSATGIPSGHPGTAHAQLAHEPAATIAYSVSVGSAGDVNGDGFSDVIVAATPAVFPVTQGAAYVFVGSSTGIANGVPTTAHLRIQQVPTALGSIVLDIAASAGDVNGDGYSDVVVGSASSSSALVYLANSRGRTVLARQRRGDGSALPIQPGGSAYSENSFLAEITARSAVGRERAKVEIETCPTGSPFGVPACLRQTSPTWVDLGTTGAVFNQTIVGLTPNTLYSWRARMLTIPSSSAETGIVPIADRSPWFRIQARATPGDFRTSVPEPGAAAGLVAGMALLAVMRRARAVG